MKKIVLSSLLFVFILSFFTNCNNQSKQQTTDTIAAAKDVTAGWKIGVQMWTFHNFSFIVGVAKADSRYQIHRSFSWSATGWKF
jgi:uncharacterized protein with GYD domain